MDKAYSSFLSTTFFTMVGQVRVRDTGRKDKKISYLCRRILLNKKRFHYPPTTMVTSFVTTKDDNTVDI